MKTCCGCPLKTSLCEQLPNVFLSSLSVADLIVGLVVGPVWIVIKRWIPEPPFNTVLHDFTDLLWIQGNLVLSTELMA